MVVCGVGCSASEGGSAVGVERLADAEGASVWGDRGFGFGFGGRGGGKEAEYFFASCALASEPFDAWTLFLSTRSLCSVVGNSSDISSWPLRRGRSVVILVAAFPHLDFTVVV